MNSAVKQESRTVMREERGRNRVRIVHIYKDFDIYNGLIEEFLLLAKMIDRRNYDLRVCVFNYRGSDFGKRFRELGGTLDSLNSKWEDNPFIIYRLYRYLKGLNPDIVQTYVLKPNLYGRIAALLAGVPVVISTELTLRDQAHSFLSRLRDLVLHLLNGFLNQYTDVVLCASEAIKRQWDTKNVSSKLRVLLPHFDPSKLCASDCQRDWNREIGDGNWVIGTVGRLSEEKRHVDLLKAFVEVRKVFPMARLLIVGDGNMRQQLMEMARQRNVAEAVTFAGFQVNVAEFLGRMHLFVLPSRTEGLGIVLLEAMTMGLPIVATNIGGIPELVLHNETGILVQPFQYRDLAAAIVELLSDPGKMQVMGERGKQWVSSRFSAEKFIRQHENLYKSALMAKKAVQRRTGAIRQRH